MQNKPNLLKCQTNITSALTKNYENKPPFRTLRKQTQSNPISNLFFAFLASPVGFSEFSVAKKIKIILNSKIVIGGTCKKSMQCGKNFLQTGKKQRLFTAKRRLHTGQSGMFFILFI